MPDPTPTPLGKTKIVLADGERTVLTPAHAWCLLAATVVAAALRLYGIGAWSLWIDEAHTWRDATMPLAGENGFLASLRLLYSLTFFLLRGLLAIGVLGEGEASLRLPFVLVGIVTVPLLGICGRRLVGAWGATLAAGILAINPWHVYWSQNARGYVFVVFAAVLAAERMFAYARHDRLRDLLLVWLYIAVGTFSHSTGLLLAAGFVVFLVLRHRALDRRRLLWLAIAAALVSLALPTAVDQLSPFQEFQQAKASPSLLHFLQTSGFYFRPAVLVMAAVGLWQLWHYGGRDRALALGSLCVVPFYVLVVVGSTRVLTTARYAICTLPAITWLQAFAAVHIAGALLRAPQFGRLPRTLAACTLPLLLAGEHVGALVDYYTAQHGQRARWSEAAGWLQQQAAGRPIRVSTINEPSLLYYLRPGHWSHRVPAHSAQNRVVPLIHWMVRDGVDETKARVCGPGAEHHLAWHRDEARAKGAFFAFVVTWPELVEHDPGGSLRAQLHEHCRLALYLPCWVGPKDESIHVYVLKEP